MTIEILKSDFNVFEKQAFLLSVEWEIEHATNISVVLRLHHDGEEISNKTAYYLASNFQLEIRRMMLEKSLSN